MKFKICHNDEFSSVVTKKGNDEKMIKAYIDAASKGNPGPSGGGLMITGEEHYIQESFALGELTNHQAEFAMIIKAMEYLVKKNWQSKTIFLYTDSKILAQTIEKNHTKNPAFLPYLKQFQMFEAQFDLLIIQWIPESQNKGADHLARQGLQKQLRL